MQIGTLLGDKYGVKMGNINTQNSFQCKYAVFDPPEVNHLYQSTSLN